MATAIRLTPSCGVCPACNRRFSTTQPHDKKLAQDIARANAAITILDTYSTTNVSLREACEMEAVRMRRALTDHRLLWTIYRRSDRATGYGIALVKASR